MRVFFDQNSYQLDIVAKSHLYHCDNLSVFHMCDQTCWLVKAL